MGEVFQKSATDAAITGRLRELETAANTYRASTRPSCPAFHSIGAAAILSIDGSPGRHGRHPSQSPEFAQDWPDHGTGDYPRFGLGIMAAFAREQMSRQIHTRAQLESLLGTNCLAVIPAFAAKGSALRKQRDQQGLRSIPTDLRRRAVFGNRGGAALTSRSPSTCIRPGPKVIGFVSATSGEGKTTVAGGFAAFLAKSGARTLLIDADLRNPRMTRTLDYTDARGLLELVADKSPFAELVKTDAKHKFDFLASSTRIRPTNSSDILNSPAVKQMLRRPRMTTIMSSSTCLRLSVVRRQGGGRKCSMLSSWCRMGEPRRPMSSGYPSCWWA